jgi:threonylcarbamoyladenosine tRNA methylthiotransferase CDKAL1
MGLRFYLETYGCSLNSADSDIIVSQMARMGASRVALPREADVVIINTCGVKEPTEDRLVYRIEQLSHEHAPMVVAGCLPKISPERVKRANPRFAAIIGPQSIASIQSIIKRSLSGERGIVHLDADPGSKLSFFEGPSGGAVCTVPICEGCLGHCTYCAIRLARGYIKSYKISDLHGVILRCVHQGYREIRLTAQDVSAFGHDTNEDVVGLLRVLEGIEGKHMFRLGMLNPSLPRDKLDGLLDVMQSDRFFKFFHVPLQSGSNRMLRAMGRSYSVADWLSAMKRIRETFPRATIATDVIVGFPGESEDDFQETVDVIDRTAPEIVNISKYGDRPGTPSSASPDKIDTSIKKTRSRRLSEIVVKSSIAANVSWIGWTGRVIATEPGPRGGLVCRNWAYRPIVVHHSVCIGEDARVRIVSAHRAYFTGEPLD